MKNFKHLLFITISFLSLNAYAQTNRKTLNYQAVILDPKAIDIPGASITGQPLNKGNVCLRFSLLNAQGGLDYEETQQVTTDEFGLVSVAIGTGSQAQVGNSTSIYKSFDSVVWNASVKSLKVSVSYDGCSSFKQVSTQNFNYTPYALYAEAVDYKNVREAPTKLSQFSNDAGFLIPEDLDPLKTDIQGNSTKIATANQNIADNKQASDEAFLVVNQSISSLDKQVASNTSSITTINTKIAEQQNQIVDNRNQIAATNNTMNAQIGGLQGQLNITNNTVSNLTGVAEMQSNKSTAVDLGGANPSDQAYPSQKAAKAYVDQVVSQIATIGVPDATTLAAGKVQLAGDLGGTATNPTVPALASKANIASPAFSGVPTAPTPASSDNSTKIATTAFVQAATAGIVLQAAVDAKANIASPAFTGTPTAPTPTLGDNSTKLATTAYVDAQVSAGAADASTSSKGIVKLSGDLGGTATSPTVPGLLLKEDVSNKSDAALGTSTTLYPTQNAVKTYVDAQVASATIVDADATTKGKIQLAGDLAGSASLPTVPGLALKANASDVTTSLALKEDAANKSNAALGTSTTLFPTQNAVKTYVDAQVSSATIVDADATTRGKIQLAGDLAGSATSPSVIKLRGTPISSVAPVTAGHVLTYEASGSGVAYWAAPANSANTISGVVPVANGGTGLSSLTDGGAVYASSTSALTTGTLPLSAGGTGVTTQQAAINILTGTQTAGRYLRSDGTDARLTAIQAADVPTLNQNTTGTAANVTGTVALANGGTGATSASAALTALGAAPIASPTFTGTVTAPIYASAPQNLTDAATISWNPTSGLNAGVTLGGNRTLSFSPAPASGSYGTLVITQDGTGGRTLTLPSGTNKVLGSTSTTTVALSSAANAKDILNFYFDGTTYFWNIGQGYGSTATITANNIAGGAAGSIPYQTGAGATGLLAKGNDGQILTLASGVPSWTNASATGVTSVAMTTPTGLNVSGSPITSTGTLALSLSTGYEIPTTSSQSNWNTAYTNRITSATSPLTISSNAISLGTVPVSLGGTGATTFATNNVLLGNGTSALQVVAPGSSGNVLTSNGTTWTSAAAGVPYSGATGAVDLGAYDLTVHGLTVGRGRLAVATNTAIGYASLASNTTTGVNNTATGYATLSANTTGANNTASGYGALNVNQGGSNNSAYGNRSLLANVSGGMNTSMGSFSLSANTASNNTAFGYGALANNVGGTNNVAQGGNSLSNNTSGSDNTAIGMNGMLMNTTGSYNTTLGSLADINANNLSNSIALGYGARVLASNTIQLGSDGSSLTLGGNTYTTTAISNVRTSGTLTLKDVTYPNTHRSTAGDVLTITNTGTASWAAPVASGVPYSGASGAVNLGAYELTSNGVTVGRGASSKANNYAYGYAVLSANTTGNYNNAFGHQALTANTTGQENNAFGEYVMPKNIGGNYNTAMGSNALKENTSGSGNTGFGKQALQTNSTGSNNTAIGHQANVSVDGLSNATAIGNGATVTASNTIQLGNSAVTNVKTNGTITAKDVTYPNTHNSTAGQVLTVNATGTASWAAPSGGSSSGGHYVGEVYGGGIVFYVTTGGYHGLIASSTDIVANPDVIIDLATSPTNKSASNDESLYTDWAIPTLSQLSLLYAARATTGLNNFTAGAVYISTTNLAGNPWTYKCLKFSDGTSYNANGDWTDANGQGQLRGRAIRTF